MTGVNDRSPVAPVKPSGRARPGAGAPGLIASGRSAAGPLARRGFRPVLRASVSPEVRFVAAAVAALLLLVLTYVVFVSTDTGQRAENLALRGVELRSAAEREAALDRLAQVTVVGFALAVGAVFVIGIVRRRGGLGALAAGTMIVSVALAELLKEIVPRPELVSGPGWLLRNSFPSGSAAVAVSFAIGALLVSPARIRWLVLPAGAAYGAVVGEAVQATGWHRLSDTVGATLLVIGIGCLALALLARAGLVHRSDRGFVDRRISRGLIVLSLLALVIGGLLLLLPAVFPVLASPVGSRRAFLQAAFPLVGMGVIALAITLFARLIEPYSLGRTADQPGDDASRPAIP
jgi:hypothetical protein